MKRWHQNNGGDAHAKLMATNLLCAAISLGFTLGNVATCTQVLGTCVWEMSRSKGGAMLVKPSKVVPAAANTADGQNGDEAAV